MFAAIKNNFFKVKVKKEKKFEKTEFIKLQQEIHSTNDQIRAAYNNFNYATDSDSISYYAYLIKALEMKYALLLKQAKQNKYGA